MTDEIGYVYETDADGEYKRTTGLIQKLEDADVVSKSKNLTHREREIALLKYDPAAFIHRTVYQPFDNVLRVDLMDIWFRTRKWMCFTTICIQTIFASASLP